MKKQTSQKKTRHFLLPPMNLKRMKRSKLVKNIPKKGGKEKPVSKRVKWEKETQPVKKA